MVGHISGPLDKALGKPPPAPSFNTDINPPPGSHAPSPAASTAAPTPTPITATPFDINTLVRRLFIEYTEGFFYRQFIARPLLVAVILSRAPEQRKELQKLLIELKASPTTPDENELSALDVEVGLHYRSRVFVPYYLLISSFCSFHWQLFEAIRSRNVDDVKRALETKGVNVDSKLDEKSPLFAAVHAYDMDILRAMPIIQLLLDAKADVHKRARMKRYAGVESRAPESFVDLVHNHVRHIHTDTQHTHTARTHTHSSFACALIIRPSCILPLPSFRFSIQTRSPTTSKKATLCLCSCLCAHFETSVFSTASRV